MTKAQLEKIFPSKTFADVLLYFVLHPQEETILARIVRGTDKALIQVQRVLKRLIASGLVKKSCRDKKTYYRANNSNFVFQDLKQLLLKTVIFSKPVDQELSVIKDKIVYGFIFGSTASGDDSSESDIDIFLIGNLQFEETSGFSLVLSQELGREVNIVLLTPSDFQRKLSQNNVFICNVIQNPKIWLFGDEQDFEKISR